MMHDWLRNLEDEAIVAWASKGLLRRGAKTLEALAPEQGPGHWVLDDGRASAALEGHAQVLEGTGFAGLRCGCPAYGPCHHLCALLLGLRQRLALVQPRPGTGATEAADPWLQGDAQDLGQALGAAALRRGLRWLAEGVQAVLEPGPLGLVGRLAEPEAAEVRLPRAGGLAGSSCSCKAPSCAHRALVVLQARRDAGAPVPDLPAEVLDTTALARLEQARQWMQALVLQGSCAMGPAFLDQGEALATELRQAELPRPGGLLQVLVRGLRAQRAGRAGAAQALEPLMAALWMLLRGLGQQPLPRPLRELAGVHRRSYRRVDRLRLRAIAAELWHTRGGQRGFSVHFQDVDGGRYLCWSASRAEGMDPEWQPAEVLEHDSLYGRRLEQLGRGLQVLAGGWASEDGRLSTREGARWEAVPAQDQALPLPATDDVQALARRHAVQLHADPWQQRPPTWARLAWTACGPWQADALSGRWSLDGGQGLRLTGELQGPQGRSGRVLRRRLDQGLVPREVFGRVEFTAGRLELLPVAVLWNGRDGYEALSLEARA
jgi:hypothetical protein